MRVVSMTPAQMFLGFTCGGMKQVSNEKLGKKPRYGAEPVIGAYEKNIHSSQAEMAVAKMVNQFWCGNVNNAEGKADVGKDIQVRSTPLPDGCLILHPDDPDDHVFYLVRTHRAPDFEVYGYMRGRDGKRQEFWRTTGVRYPAFFVPARFLTEIFEE